MKSMIAAFALAVSLAASGLIYPATMEITDIRGDVVELTTASGMVYEMTGAEDYQTGDFVSLLMFSYGTEDVTDDAILAARYSGFTR